MRYYLFVDSPLDLSLPLMLSPSSTLAKTTITVNPINVNVGNEANFNEDRNSVTWSEDSGISSSNGDESLPTTNGKDNQSSHGMPRSMMSPLNINAAETVEIREKLLKITKMDKQLKSPKQTLRPNSASSESSNVSEPESINALSPLRLTGEAISDLVQKVVK